MKLCVSEFAKAVGVSVRTLHYYDRIGLLKPDHVESENGYRYYGKTAFERMQEILFFRELDFSLAQIKKIISSPDYDKAKALREQKDLLLLKKERLERIISALDSAEKGESIMDFNIFDNSEFDACKDEVVSRWGKTDAYKENCEKTKNYSKDKWNSVAEGINGIMAEFAAAKADGKCLADAAPIVKKLQDFITETQYTCTDEILISLGEMYVSDVRFKKNIDKHGEGVAEYIAGAIVEYCKK